MLLLILLLFILLLFLLTLFFWPRRRPSIRRVTKSYNGQRYGKDQELY